MCMLLSYVGGVGIQFHTFLTATENRSRRSGPRPIISPLVECTKELIKYVCIGAGLDTLEEIKYSCPSLARIELKFRNSPACTLIMPVILTTSPYFPFRIKILET